MVSSLGGGTFRPVYAYAGNNPIANVDVDGRFHLEVTYAYYSVCAMDTCTEIPYVVSSRWVADPWDFWGQRIVATGVATVARFGVGLNRLGAGVAGAANVAGLWITSRLIRSLNGSFDVYRVPPEKVRSMRARGWTWADVERTIQTGQAIPAINKSNGHPATRFVDPITGKSIVVDDVTHEVIHFGGEGFTYGPGSGDLQ